MEESSNTGEGPSSDGTTGGARAASPYQSDLQPVDAPRSAWPTSAGPTDWMDVLDASVLPWTSSRSGERKLEFAGERRGPLSLTAQELAGDCLRLSVGLPDVRRHQDRAYRNLARLSCDVSYIKACLSEAGDLHLAIDLPRETLTPDVLLALSNHLAAWGDITDKDITAKDDLMKTRRPMMRQCAPDAPLQAEAARVQLRELFQQLDLPWREHRQDLYVTAMEFALFGTPTRTNLTVRILPDCVSFCVPSFGGHDYLDKHTGTDILAKILKFNHEQAVGKLAVDAEGHLSLWCELPQPYLGVVDDLTRLSEKVSVSGALFLDVPGSLR